MESCEYMSSPSILDPLAFPLSTTTYYLYVVRYIRMSKNGDIFDYR